MSIATGDYADWLQENPLSNFSASLHRAALLYHVVHELGFLQENIMQSLAGQASWICRETR